MSALDNMKQKYKERANQYATKSDVDAIKADTKALKERLDNPNGQKPGVRALKFVKEGFDNVAKSLSSPNDKRRPKISQMPGSRSDIDIVAKGDHFLNLKHPAFRSVDIRGRKVSRVRKEN